MSFLWYNEATFMIITPIKTRTVKANDSTLKDFLLQSLTQVKENEIVVVTSKVVSLCEGNVRTVTEVSRDELITSEADYILPAQANPYGFHITIKNNTLIASAGIDESNGDGNFVLWPKNPQDSANEIRKILKETFGVKNVGVLITDSHVLPLRWGTVGTSIAHSGFEALNSYIGQPDLFGRNLKVTYSNVAEGLASAAVVAMGEGNESTPLAIISDAEFVHFQEENPTVEELAKLAISKEEDIFAPLLNSVTWQSKQK